MRTLVFTLALAACAAAAAPALAAIYAFEATLDGGSEAPPNASPGFGFSQLFLDTDLHTLRVVAEFQDLLAPTTAAHIHAPTNQPESGTAFVATMTPSFVGFPLGVTAGIYDHTFDTSLASTWNPTFVNGFGGTPLSAEAALLESLLLTRAYFNVHTSFAPGGEIRGFYRQLAVPEPGTWALMVAGFGLAGGLLRRRAARALAAA